MHKKLRNQSRIVHFDGFDGSQLEGSLDFPVDYQPDHYVIMSHCFTCSKQLLTSARLSRDLAKAGIAVLRFDFTGLGYSEGKFANTHFTSMVRDISCAADWLATHYRPASVLIGHSMGGTASLAASQESLASLAELKKIITLASPSFPAHVLHHFGSAMAQLERGEDAEILVAGQTYPVKPAFVEDVRSYDMDAQMSDCNTPIMAIRAGDDELVGPQAADQILQFTQAERQLRQIDGADHLFSDKAHAAQVLHNIIDWLN